MAKMEPIGLVSAILSLIGLIFLPFFSKYLGEIILILAIVTLVISFYRIRKDISYTVKWPLYFSLIVIGIILILRVVLMLNLFRIPFLTG